MHLNCLLVAVRFSSLLLISHMDLSNPDSYYHCKHGEKLCPWGNALFVYGNREIVSPAALFETKTQANSRRGYHYFISVYMIYLGHMAWRPPSIGRLTPVMKLAASDARKAMLWATSSTSPGLPRAWVCLDFARNWKRFTELAEIWSYVCLDLMTYRNLKGEWKDWGDLQHICQARTEQKKITFAMLSCHPNTTMRNIC